MPGCRTPSRALLRDDAVDRLAPIELVALIDENADLLPGSAGEALESAAGRPAGGAGPAAAGGPVLEKLMRAAPSPAGRAGIWRPAGGAAAARERRGRRAGGADGLCRSAGSRRRWRSWPSGGRCSPPTHGPAGRLLRARWRRLPSSTPRLPSWRGPRCRSRRRTGGAPTGRWPTTSARPCRPPARWTTRSARRCCASHRRGARGRRRDAERVAHRRRAAHGQRAAGDMFHLLTAAPVRCPPTPRICRGRAAGGRRWRARPPAPCCRRCEPLLRGIFGPLGGNPLASAPPLTMFRDLGPRGRPRGLVSRGRASNRPSAGRNGVLDGRIHHRSIHWGWSRMIRAATRNITGRKSRRTTSSRRTA